MILQSIRLTLHITDAIVSQDGHVGTGWNEFVCKLSSYDDENYELT